LTYKVYVRGSKLNMLPFPKDGRDAIQWVRDRWNIDYSYSGLHAGLQRLNCAPKVPRPQSVKADMNRQAWWKAHGLRDSLQKAGIARDDRVWFCDEMRFGLWGQVRKRWGLRGVKIIQKVQIEFAWEYLVLAVDVGQGQLRWGWAKRMNQTNLLPIFKRWLPNAVELFSILVNQRAYFKS